MQQAPCYMVHSWGRGIFLDLWSCTILLLHPSACGSSFDPLSWDLIAPQTEHYTHNTILLHYTESSFCVPRFGSRASLTLLASSACKLSTSGGLKSQNLRRPGFYQRSAVLTDTKKGCVEVHIFVTSALNRHKCCALHYSCLVSGAGAQTVMGRRAPERFESLVTKSELSYPGLNTWRVDLQPITLRCDTRVCPVVFAIMLMVPRSVWRGEGQAVI